ncbi:Nitrogen permease regulator 2 (NPR2) family [Blumeria hordei DH14]|uniref:Nitrogen permease regulator 2 (NPR2) family n=1 Tax=Blumeria graminis f. sp. hordei (strain DH14) TaxID=546991 RepID=N1JDK6_BLUG1|nr:Nitrogen permease regulator 2 (NPR2) family [Blumeria hordei DH14]
MIQGIFFAVFLPQKGTKVVYQSPACSITTEIGVEKACLLDFEAIAEFVIPRQVFCNRYITVCDPNNKYRILGHPVCIQNQKYVRNEFIFNFCIVIKTDTDPLPYETVVRRLAGTFTEMEIQNQFLSHEVKEESLPNTRGRHSIAALLEIIKEDLNNYHECMIPADDANTINMKLFPVRRPPPPVKSWHVPVLKIHLSKYMDDTWDLTLVKVINFIDGIRDVRRISYDADVCINLAKVALQHLLYYDAILLLDIFFFSNIYAPNPHIRGFITNEDQMQEECSNYVCINGPMVDNFYLSRLYTSLAPGRTLIAWLKLHRDDGLEVLDHIDVRRFIQFGIIKGFLYRIHTYALSSQISTSPTTKDTVIDTSKSDDLVNYADGCHCFDQIIVEKNLSQAQILEQLLAIANVDVEIIYR